MILHFDLHDIHFNGCFVFKRHKDDFHYIFSKGLRGRGWWRQGMNERDGDRIKYVKCLYIMFFYFFFAIIGLSSLWRNKYRTQFKPTNFFFFNSRSTRCCELSSYRDAKGKNKHLWRPDRLSFNTNTNLSVTHKTHSHTKHSISPVDVCVCVCAIRSWGVIHDEL